MAGVNETPENISEQKNSDYENVDKILSVVVKRRKFTPKKCMEINKKIFACEIQKLENAKVVIDESKEKEKFWKLIQGFRRLKTVQCNLDDLHEAEHKLEKCFKQIKEINNYLEKRKNHM